MLVDLVVSLTTSWAYCLSWKTQPHPLLKTKDVAICAKYCMKDLSTFFNQYCMWSICIGVAVTSQGDYQGDIPVNCCQHSSITEEEHFQRNSYPRVYHIPKMEVSPLMLGTARGEIRSPTSNCGFYVQWTVNALVVLIGKGTDNVCGSKWTSYLVTRFLSFPLILTMVVWISHLGCCLGSDLWYRHLGLHWSSGLLLLKVSGPSPN